MCPVPDHTPQHLEPLPKPPSATKYTLTVSIRLGKFKVEIYTSGLKRGCGFARWDRGTWAVPSFILTGMRPICFLSDFGLADDFVGTCKGVMLGIAPGVAIVDLAHELPGFEVEVGAEILQHATRYMPEDAVYLAVVDPGVGTERRGLARRGESGGFFVGGDNRLLLPAAKALGGIRRAVHLTNQRYYVKPVSNSFHGRDIFSPVA